MKAHKVWQESKIERAQGWLSPKGEPQTRREEPIKTYVRVKPLLKTNTQESVRLLNDKQIEIITPNYPPDLDRVFNYERVFPGTGTNLQLFHSTMLEPIHNLLAGFNSTVFIYGMTGAGKSYTMFNQLMFNHPQSPPIFNHPQYTPHPRPTEAAQHSKPFEDHEDVEYGQDQQDVGLVGQTITRLFREASQQPQSSYSIGVSFYEIYNQNIRDLLSESAQTLSVLQDPNRGVFINDLAQVVVGSQAEARSVIQEGLEKRAINSTKSNLVSSRSHAILQLNYKQYSRQPGSQTLLQESKLFMIDLAGNEKTGQNETKRFIEGVNINKSLLTLGKCINILSEHRRPAFIPFRDSKLTRILKDSLGGSSKTVMIACISSDLAHYEETLNTLKYSSKAKRIKNSLKPNPKTILPKTHDNILPKTHDNILLKTHQTTLLKNNENKLLKDHENILKANETARWAPTPTNQTYAPLGSLSLQQEETIYCFVNSMESILKKKCEMERVKEELEVCLYQNQRALLQTVQPQVCKQHIKEVSKLIGELQHKLAALAGELQEEIHQFTTNIHQMIIQQPKASTHLPIHQNRIGSNHHILHQPASQHKKYRNQSTGKEFMLQKHKKSALVGPQSRDVVRTEESRQNSTPHHATPILQSANTSSSLMRNIEIDLGLAKKHSKNKIRCIKIEENQRHSNLTDYSLSQNPTDYNHRHNQQNNHTHNHQNNHNHRHNKYNNPIDQSQGHNKENIPSNKNIRSPESSLKSSTKRHLDRTAVFRKQPLGPKISIHVNPLQPTGKPAAYKQDWECESSDSLAVRDNCRVRLRRVDKNPEAFSRSAISSVLEELEREECELSKVEKSMVNKLKFMLKNMENPYGPAKTTQKDLKGQRQPSSKRF